MDNLKYVKYSKENGRAVEGYFVKTNKGFVKIIIFEEQFFEFPEEAKIIDAEINLLTGKVIKYDKANN